MTERETRARRTIARRTRMASTYAVIWTRRNGSTAQWHYARRDIAEATAASLRLGWRTDACVVPV